MSRLSATLPVEFSPGEAPPLILEPGSTEPGAMTSSVIKLRLFPAVEALLRATAGTVVFAETRIRRVVYEILAFRGDNRVRTRYPISGGFSWQSLNLAFDRQGRTVQPVITHDLLTSEVIADQAFYGGVRVAYDAAYRVIDYTPEIHWNPQIASGGAVIVQTGMVLAYYQGQIATLSVEAEFGEPSAQYVELYRVISHIVLDPDGAWEEPPGWPEENKYPTTNAEGPDPDNSFTDERPHEIARINTLGQIDISNYYVSWAKPYTGASNYRPRYRLRRGVAPEGYQEAFAVVDWGQIRQRLARLYPGLEE